MSEPAPLPLLVPPHILLVSGDDRLHDTVQEGLAGRFQVQRVGDLDEARRASDTAPPSVWLVDLDSQLQSADEAQLESPVERLSRESAYSGVPIIFLAGEAGDEEGDSPFLLKPFTSRELRTCVSSQMRLSRVRQEMAQALRQSEARYRAIVEGQSEMVSRFRMDGALLFVNGAYARARGSTPEALIGANFWDYIDEEDHPAVRAMLERITPESPEIRIENRFETADGVRWTLWANRGLAFDEEGRPTELQSAGIDITDRKRAEEALRQSEQRFRLMADAAPVFIWITGVDKETTWLNEGWLQFTGRRMEQELGFGWLENVHPDDYEHCYTTYVQSFDSHRPFSMEYRLRRHDGQYRWVLDNGMPLYTGGGEFKGYIGSAIDIHDRKMAEQTLRRLNETLEERVERRTRQVRQLLARLTMAEQEERRHVSQILHDDLQQLLYGIEMKIAIIEGDLQEIGRPHHLNELAEARAWIGQAIRTTRQLTVDLSPPILQNEGLADALLWLSSQMRELHGLEVTIDAEHSFYLADEDIRVLLFHVVRELLFNVKKHAGVSRATVRLQQEEGHMVIEVSDEGAGFETDMLFTRSYQERGFGLFSIRERLKLLGGQLHISSGRDSGTQVTARLPVRF